jgi:uncharacterized protein involved in exopolysaccharide biosynthesis
MEPTDNPTRETSTSSALPVTKQVVYIVPEDGIIGRSRDEIDLITLCQSVWSGRWFVVGITALFTIASIAYALLATEWYRAEVLLAPAEEKSTLGLAAQLGGLANLAGITVGGGGTVEPVAVLKSRSFAKEFIEDLELLTLIFAEDWDSSAQRWKSKDPTDWPDIRDAVKYFDENIRSVREDALTGLVTLVIEWEDPEVASDWANLLVERLNDRMRQRALIDAESNVAYLEAELNRTSLVTLQQSIGRLLESEVQKLMLARGNEEFAFRVIDPAEPPKRRVWPKRTLIVLLSTFVGGVFAITVVLLRNAFLRGKRVLPLPQ